RTRPLLLTWPSLRSGPRSRTPAVEVVGNGRRRFKTALSMDRVAVAQLKGAGAMARYKPYDLNQSKMIPLSYADQIVEGSFEHALNEIVEEHLDLTVFEQRYANDETGRPAHDPKILLKVVLYGYYKGMISSRALAEACRRNVVFMALSADTRPHFTT